MSDSTPNPAATTPSAPVPPASPPDPVAFFFALGSVARWHIVRWLADGRAASVSDIAAAINLERDLTAKQLRVLRDAGVLESRDGTDRRQTLYQIPATCRTQPGEINYGLCLLRL